MIHPKNSKPSYDSISLYYWVLNVDAALDLAYGGDRGFRFLCCFRFKLWWMTQRMGSSGREVPYETQFMLVEGPSDKFTVMLPILDGSFRASLQGNEEDELQLCLESGGEL